MTHGMFWKKLIGGLLMVAIVGYVAACGYMYANQRHILYVPAHGELDIPQLTPFGYDMVRYEAEDGQQLFAFYRPADKGMKTILFLHGNTGLHLDRPTKYQDLAKRGYGVLAASYRGFEGNDGEPSEDGIALDARAAFNLLTEGLNIPRGDIVIYGESLGSAVAAELAEAVEKGKQDNIRALILDAPFTSAVTLGSWRYPWLPVDALLMDRFDTISRIGNIHVPVLIMNGAKDDVVPPSMGEALAEKANQPKTFVQIPDGHHSDLYDFGAGQVVDNFLGTTK